MSFATTHDRRNVTILRDNMTTNVPTEGLTFRKYHSDRSQGKRMTIDGINVEWHRSGEEAWYPYNLRVFGTVFKVDGTLGLTAGQHDYIDYASYHSDPPAWLMAEIELYAPREVW